MVMDKKDWFLLCVFLLLVCIFVVDAVFNNTFVSNAPSYEDSASEGSESSINEKLLKPVIDAGVYHSVNTGSRSFTKPFEKA